MHVCDLSNVWCYLKDGKCLGRSPRKITFPFFLSFFTLFSPSLCCPPLLSSFLWGMVANGFFSHCCAPSNHLLCSNTPPPSPSPHWLPSPQCTDWLFVRHAPHHDNKLGVYTPARWWLQDYSVTELQASFSTFNGSATFLKTKDMSPYTKLDTGYVYWSF